MQDKAFRRFVIVNTFVFLALFAAVPIHSASAAGINDVVVQTSELSSTSISGTTLKINLESFRPNTTIYFKIQFSNSETVSVTSSDTNLKVPAGTAFQFSIKSGEVLDQGDIGKPIRDFNIGASWMKKLQVFPTPPDFPVISFSGRTELVNSKEILSTPVVKSGTYAVDSIGTKIRFFIKSKNNLIGFRKINDTKSVFTPGGTPVYAYLEQKDFRVSATSPGTWRLLDENFDVVARINHVKTKFGVVQPEGHGITSSPSGNSVVMTAVTRTVDSSWLKRQYKAPILDCDIAEVVDGKAIKEFSFWDWAVANKKISQPLFDSMPLFNDPQDPVNSPIDICHVNSMQFSNLTNQYVFSLRSPSIILIVDKDLKKVIKVLPADNALQHFARFRSKNQITALGNYSLDKVSKFLDFKQVNGEWKLSEYVFPTHVMFCGNTNYLDDNHIWLGGGCGAFKPGVLGAIYEKRGNELIEVGLVKMSNFIYSYRADLL